MAGSLVITNGDSAGQLLRRSGLLDRDDILLLWRDNLHDGPVPAGLSLEALSQERARFLASAMRLDEQEVRHAFADRDALVRRHRDFPRVVVWLEHDLYDQLQLLQILDVFARDGRRDGSLRLVQASDYLGTQTVETIRRFAGLEQPVAAAQLELAARAWRAFCAATPEGVAALLAEDLRALRFLRAAVGRLLEEFPDLRSGLPRTERATLRALDEGTR
ncbi:MAG: DUF1835 domain-containing protein, partial [Pseudomonadota bacterium]|nr:DUF1835 domain-containing protein [Pseudomonadota bacterium]